MVTLFVLSTLEGWPDYMNQALNSTSNGPIKGANSPYTQLMFALFIMIGSIFSVNLFIAILSLAEVHA